VSLDKPKRGLKEQRAKKRAEAEARNASYQKLSLKDKMERNSHKVRLKLAAQNG